MKKKKSSILLIEQKGLDLCSDLNQPFEVPQEQHGIDGRNKDRKSRCGSKCNPTLSKGREISRRSVMRTTVTVLLETPLRQGPSLRILWRSAVARVVIVTIVFTGDRRRRRLGDGTLSIAFLGRRGARTRRRICQVNLICWRGARSLSLCVTLRGRRLLRWDRYMIRRGRGSGRSLVRGT